MCVDLCLIFESSALTKYVFVVISLSGIVVIALSMVVVPTEASEETLPFCTAGCDTNPKSGVADFNRPKPSGQATSRLE